MYRSREELAAETAAAKETDILAVARNLGIELKGQGSTYRDKNDKGLVFFPRTNSFFDYYRNTGGSTIDLVMYMEDISFKDAVSRLLDMSGYNRTGGMDYEYRDHAHPGSGRFVNVENKPGMEKKEAKIFKLPAANDNYKRVFAYLVNSRCISSKVVSRLMHEKKIYEEKDRHNAVFVCHDTEGNARHAFLRGTLDYYCWRGDVYGSDKRYGFSVEGTGEKLVVFEAPIDLMSYMTIKEAAGINEKSGVTFPHLLALGMLSPEPIDTYIKEHPSVKEISFLLDADTYGRKASEKFIEEYSKKGYKCSNNDLVEKLTASGTKDVNEYLQTYFKKEKRQDKRKEASGNRVHSR